ncbi:MAG: LamG domain-containing protein, partial [Ilumatobacteraceae bacterium]
MAQNVSHRIASLALLVVAVSVIAVGSVVASGPLSSGAATVVAANPATDDVGRGDDDLVAPRTISSGDEDYAMVFDGNGATAGSYLTGDSTALGNLTDYTVEAWFKVDASVTLSTNNLPIVDRADDYGLLLNGGTLHWRVGASGGTNTIDSGTPILAGVWYHAALVRQGASADVFVNSQEVVSNASVASGAANSARPLLVGAQDFDDNGAADRYFPGEIDEVRIYSDARTQSEIEADMHTYATCAYVNCASSGNTYNDDNLVAYYDFNEGPA